MDPLAMGLISVIFSLSFFPSFCVFMGLHSVIFHKQGVVRSKSWLECAWHDSTDPGETAWGQDQGLYGIGSK